MLVQRTLTWERSCTIAQFVHDGLLDVVTPKNEVTTMARVFRASRKIPAEGQNQGFSPLLAPKSVLRARHFRSDEEVKEAVHDWLVQQPKYLFSRGIHPLVERCRRCVESGGDCSKD